MAYYYPRMAALAKVPGPEAGQVFDLPLRPVEATLELNDHNTADSLKLVCDWHTVGVDPRIMRNATIYFHLDGTEGGTVPLEPSVRGGRTGAGNLRFVGTVSEFHRISADQEPYQVTIAAVDYTDFFLQAKPFGSNGIPDYSQTLDDAFRRIVSQTPGAEKLADRLERRGLGSWPKLADAVPPRLGGKGTIRVEQNTDAWSVWMQTVGMLGLISFVELDKVIVTTSEAYYRKNDPPVLAWGLNLSRLEEDRNSAAFGTGIGISSFDPTTGRTVEGVWPPRQEKTSKRKKLRAVQNTADPDAAIVQKYDWFTAGALLTEAAAANLAKRVYNERSKQEFQGRATTSEMLVQTANGEPFSLLDLRPGDNVYVNANDSGADTLLGLLESDAARIAYLVDRGYDEDAARIITAYANDLPTLSNEFYVKRVTTRFEVDEDSGSYETEVEFCNQILVDEAE